MLRASPVAWLPGLLALGIAAAPLNAAQPARSAKAIAGMLKGARLAYSGRQRSEVLLATGNSTTTVRVWSDGRGKTRREFASGAASGIVTLQVGRTSWQRAPSGEWTRLPDGPSGIAASDAVAEILRNYDVSIGKPTKIAGRTALPIRIAHRRPFDPSRHVWLDQPTGILLKDVLIAPDGRVRSSSEYTEITTGAQPASLFAPPSAAASPSLVGPASFTGRASRADVERECGRTVQLPTYVPPGYRVSLFGVMHTGSGRLMPAVRYSNGMSAFSIFQRGSGGGMGGGMGPGRGRGAPGFGRGWQGGRGRGQTTPSCVAMSDPQASVVAVTAAASNYLLVGDLAESELMRVAKSLP